MAFMSTLIPLQPPPDLKALRDPQGQLAVRGLREVQAHREPPESPASPAPPVAVLGHLVIRGIKVTQGMQVIPAH